MLKIKMPFSIDEWHSKDVQNLQKEFYFATNGVFLLVFEGWAEDLISARFYICTYADED